MFNYTYRYLYMIYSSSITLNLINLSLIYIQYNFNWTKQILQTKKFLSLIEIYKLLAMMFIPAFATNAMTSDLQSSISPHWVVIFLDYHRTVFIFRSLFDLLDVVLAFLISIPKIFKSIDTGLHLRKTFGKFFRSYPELMFKFGAMSFQEYECMHKRITNPVFYIGLV